MSSPSIEDLQQIIAVSQEKMPNGIVIPSGCHMMLVAATLAQAELHRRDDYCRDCKGSGEVIGTIQPTLDPQDGYDGEVPCPKCQGTGEDQHHGLDNANQVFFYEQDFYVLSNFSSFSLEWKGHRFPTSEHAYHWEKFETTGNDSLSQAILNAVSAHDAFKFAGEYKQYRRADWDQIKLAIMLDILRAKADQHDYVRRKLLATGDRELIENSWRDAWWGWGQDHKGKNMLGKLWMQVRNELRSASV